MFKSHGLKILISLLLTAVLLYFFFRGVDLAKTRDAILGASPAWLASSLVLGLLTFFLRAVRWTWLLRPVARVPVWPAFAATATGFAANNLPGKVGEVLRPYLLSRSRSLPFSPLLAALYLAAAGVGTIGIAEFDEVDESNLQRQIIHGQSDIGKSKAESARESIAEANPYVNVVVHDERLDNDNVLQVFEGYDLIVDGTDNFATRYMVNDAAYFLKIPYVWGSIYRFDGQASVFWPHAVDEKGQSADAPCYRCLYPEPPPPGMVPSCAEGGVLGVLCASIGSIQVNEAIKVLTGIGDPIVGKLMIYDALEMEYRKLKVRKDPNCALCGENPTVTGLIDYETFCGAVSEEAADAAVGSTTPSPRKIIGNDRGALETTPSERPARAHFDAAYSAAPAAGSRPATEDRFTKCPLPGGPQRSQPSSSGAGSGPGSPMTCPSARGCSTRWPSCAVTPSRRLLHSRPSARPVTRPPMCAALSTM